MGKEEPKIETHPSQTEEDKEKEEKPKLRDFNVKSFFTKRGKTGDYYQAPGEFEAQIDEEVGYDDLMKEVVDNIGKLKPSDDQKRENRHLLFGRDAKTRNAAVDEKNNLAAFTLLEETMIMGGMSWKEAIYAIEKINNKIKGRIIDYNSGWHTSNWVHGEEGENESSELLIKEIKDGVLKYDLKTKKGTREIEIDLKKKEK
jgi:hypothetical protein